MINVIKKVFGFVLFLIGLICSSGFLIGIPELITRISNSKDEEMIAQTLGYTIAQITTALIGFFAIKYGLKLMKSKKGDKSLLDHKL